MGEFRVGRRGSDSRCCQPGVTPLTWHDYADESHPSTQAFLDWIATLIPPVQQQALGEIDALFEMASLGRLQDTEDEKSPIKPVHPDPETFELRKKYLSKALRFYHGEPDGFPLHLVNLHMHIKQGSESQRLEIAYATQRYRAGRSKGWGL